MFGSSEPRSPAFSSRVSWKAHRLLRSIPSHIKRSLEAEAPCLVHAHFGPDALDAWPLARALNLPMLVTLHGYDINTYRDWWEAGKGGPAMRTYPRRLLNLAEQPGVGFVAVSEAIRQRAIEFGIPGQKITVNYIGIDTSKFTPGGIPIAQRPPHVLFVGRLVEKKGCRYLIEAMSTVQREVPGARLIVVGDGPLRQSLEQLAQRLWRQCRFPRRPVKCVREAGTRRSPRLLSPQRHRGKRRCRGIRARAAGGPGLRRARHYLRPRRRNRRAASGGNRPCICRGGRRHALELVEQCHSRFIRFHIRESTTIRDNALRHQADNKKPGNGL